MATWIIDLITNNVLGNRIEIEADVIEKIDYQTLIIDGKKWSLPEICGLSFADVERELKEIE